MTHRGRKRPQRKRRVCDGGRKGKTSVRRWIEKIEKEPRGAEDPERESAKGMLADLDKMTSRHTLYPG